MGEGLGADAAAGHLLDAVVADSRGGAKSGVDVLLVDLQPIFGGVGPDAGETIGLEFQANRKRIGIARVLLLKLAHFGFDPENLLDVVTDLMSDYIGLGKLAGGCELPLEFVEEAEVEIDFLIARTIERSGGAVGLAAGGRCRIAEKNQLGVAVLTVGLCRENLGPIGLNVVENEGDEIDLGLFFGVERAVGNGARSGRAVVGTGAASAEKGEEVLVENQAQNADDNHPADAEMDAAETTSAAARYEASTAAATLVAAIFDVVTGSAGCPFHSF